MLHGISHKYASTLCQGTQGKFSVVFFVVLPEHILRFSSHFVTFSLASCYQASAISGFICFVTCPQQDSLGILPGHVSTGSHTSNAGTGTQPLVACQSCEAGAQKLFSTAICLVVVARKVVANRSKRNIFFFQTFGVSASLCGRILQPPNIREIGFLQEITRSQRNHWKN